MRGGTARYSSPMQSLRLILAEEGLRGLYKGNGANALRVIPVYALKFSLNDAITDELRARAGGQELTFATKVASGCAAGFVQISATYPLDLVRTRLQLGETSGAKFRGIWHCLHLTAQTEGVRGLYKGYLPSLLAGVPYVGLQMSFYSTLKKHLGPYLPSRADGQPTAVTMMICGATAGITSQTICYPLDTVRHRMQANGICGVPAVYSGTLDCLRQIWAKEGAGGFYKGVRLNTLRAVPGAAVQFTSYDMLKRLMGL
jgi:solute carrier family 25 (mitochondrial phosphate transporter), member 23/24/25/41